MNKRGRKDGRTESFPTLCKGNLWLGGKSYGQGGTERVKGKRWDADAEGLNTNYLQGGRRIGVADFFAIFLPLPK